MAKKKVLKKILKDPGDPLDKAVGQIKKKAEKAAKKGKVLTKAKPAWMEGLTDREIDIILGKPVADPMGVKKHKAGGRVGCGKALKGFGKLGRKN